MAAVRFILTIFVAFAAMAAVRRAPASTPRDGRRMAAIGGLLFAQLVVLGAFVAIQAATGWGATRANPPGLALVTQVLRVALALAAGSLWIALVRDDLKSTRHQALVALAWIAFGWGAGPLGLVAAVVLVFLFDRMKWVERVTGWSRALTLTGAALLLLLLSFFPHLNAAGAHTDIRLDVSESPWPPALLSGTLLPRVAAELAAIRPLDRALQATLDLLRVQLLIGVIKLLFLPVRLAGMSLQRRFTINHVLVRTIPAALSALVLVTIGYLALGQYKLNHVRGEFERTLARAGTAAAALADDPLVTRGAPTGAALERARRWLGPDSASAAIVLRERAPAADIDADGLAAKTDSTAADSSTVDRATPPAPLRAASPGAAAALGGAAMVGAAPPASRGLVIAGDTLYLASLHTLADGAAVEVYVPVDSAYLERAMSGVGGDLRVRVLPRVIVGNQGIEVNGRAWSTQPAVAEAREPDPPGRRRARWFLARTYLPAGDWDHLRRTAPPDSTRGTMARLGRVFADRNTRTFRRGAIELYVATTLPSLALTIARASGGIAANIVTIAIVFLLVMVFSTIERFAVRSGRSIIQAVLDEMQALRSAAERFGAGDLAFRLPVRGRDEFSVVATSFNEMAANLERQRMELAAKERLEQDLAVARDIQRRFLPQDSPGLQGLDVAGVSLPSREVGGDLFYWFTNDDGSLGFTLGDVSGKSVPAALLMSNVLSALRAQVFDRPDPGECLARTNRLIVDQIEPGRFVTLFYGEADPVRGELRFASAGHNPPLLLRADGAVTWLADGGVPLGVLPSADYQTVTARFEPGDTLVVYSDGVTEAEGAAFDAARAGSASDADGGMFGEQRLADLVAAHRGDSARTLVGAVMAAVQAFARGRPQADDITLVVVRRV